MLLNTFNFLLVLHVIFGGIGLSLGTLAMFLKKGDKQHKSIGIVYFFAMLCTGLIALILSYLHPNQFLFVTGIFTVYLVLTGRRYLKIKKTSDVIVSDWILSLMMLIFGLFFLAFGVDAVSKGNYFGSVLLVFGSVSLSFVYQDYRNFKGFSNVKNYWLISHIQRIVGSFIAAFTAFLVNNDISFLPEIISWLLPTVIIVPFITLWRRKYEIKIDKNI